MTRGFSPSDVELALVARIFSRVGNRDLGIITGDAAVEVFAESVDLPPAVLSTIWNIADEDNSGNLSERGVAIVIRLIGWAQSGKEVTPALINTPGPTPFIRGISDVTPTHGDDSNTSALPPFTLQDWKRFHKLFSECGPIKGILDGDKARDCFLESQLPPEDLWQIWNMADTRKRGSLDVNDFILGMYLIQGSTSGKLPSIPAIFPTEIYKQISDITSAENNVTRNPLPAIQPSESPASKTIAKAEHIPSTSKNHKPRAYPQDHFDDWDVTPSEKLEADRYFDTLDPDNNGYVEGVAAGKFMLKFKLPPEDLAHIWDIADLNNDNRLTRDGFAIAMHLIKIKLAGSVLPFDLPPSLIPPSSRPKASRIHSDRQSLPSSSHTDDRDSSTNSQLQTHETPRPPLPPKPAPILKTRHSISHVPTHPKNSRALSKPKDDNSERVQAHNEMILLKRVTSLEKENATLESYVQQLLDQLEAQKEIRQQNTLLAQNNDTLTARITEIELINSKLITSASETNTAAEDLVRQNKQLSRRIAEMDAIRAQLNQTSRHLEISIQENETLKLRIQEMQEAAKVTSRSLDETERFRTQIRGLEQDNKDLQDRVSDMEKSISRSQPPDSAMNARELQILMGDITRENEVLKKRLREMEQSTTHILLSSNDHTINDNLRRDNQRLTLQIREMEQFTKQLQSSSEETEMRRVLEHITQENEGLKRQSREMRRTISELRGSSRTQELQREIDSLKTEIRHLKRQIQDAPSQYTHEDPTIPPPAYDDAFVPV